MDQPGGRANFSDGSYTPNPPIHEGVDVEHKSYHAIDHVECATTGTAEHPVVTSRTLTEATMSGLNGTFRPQLRSRLVRADGQWVIRRTSVSTG